jgi:hypothetical protein
MASVVFTIKQRIALVPNVSIQVRGNAIFQSLRVIRFDRSDGPTTGEIAPGVNSVTIVTTTTEFNSIVAAVAAMGSSVDVTIHYGPSATNPGNLTVSSVLVGGPILLTPGTAPASP